MFIFVEPTNELNMAYTSISNFPKNNGMVYQRLSDIPNPIDGDQYIDTATGDIVVRNNLLDSWDALKSTTFSQPVKETFKEKLSELFMFDVIKRERYFQLKRLYSSTVASNRKMALKVVNELHATLE